MHLRGQLCKRSFGRVSAQLRARLRGIQDMMRVSEGEGDTRKKEGMVLTRVLSFPPNAPKGVRFAATMYASRAMEEARMMECQRGLLLLLR